MSSPTSPYKELGVQGPLSMIDGEREYPVSGGVVSDTVFWWAANWCPPEAAVDPDVYRAMKELYKAGKV